MKEVKVITAGKPEIVAELINEALADGWDVHTFNEGGDADNWAFSVLLIREKKEAL